MSNTECVIPNYYKNFTKLLGINGNKTTIKDIQSQFRKISIKYHPNRTGKDRTAFQEISDKRNKLIKNFENKIIISRQKSKYDEDEKIVRKFIVSGISSNTKLENEERKLPEVEMKISNMNPSQIIGITDLYNMVIQNELSYLFICSWAKEHMNKFDNRYNKLMILLNIKNLNMLRIPVQKESPNKKPEIVYFSSKEEVLEVMQKLFLEKKEEAENLFGKFIADFFSSKTNPKTLQYKIEDIEKILSKMNPSQINVITDLYNLEIQNQLTNIYMASLSNINIKDLDDLCMYLFIFIQIDNLNINTISLKLPNKKNETIFFNSKQELLDFMTNLLHGKKKNHNEKNGKKNGNNEKNRNL